MSKLIGPAKRKGLVPPDAAVRILELRGRMGMTQVAFAQKLGVSHISVCRWETGQNRPSPVIWRQIAELESTAFGDSASRAQDHPLVKEESSTYPPLQASSVPTFDGNPQAVAAVVEGERLGFGHLANPGFAAEVSMIHPLPHQRIAVYEVMLKQPRLRFLLADDAGAGKTIMTGLYVREMLARRLIRRVLVVSPAGLVGNWLREMRVLFNLSFQVVSGADAKAYNPFVGSDSDLAIVKLDTLTGERMFARLGEEGVVPYDLIVFDEAHKLASRRNPDGSIAKTGRYLLAEALCGASTEEEWALPWQSTHLLLLTATPHMGVDYPFFALWRLLEPNVLATQEALENYPEDQKRHHFIRRIKEEMVAFDGRPIYPPRESRTWTFDLNPTEQDLYNATTSYMRTYYNRARILNRSAARLAMSVFQRRLASSSYALMKSFERRLAKLDELIRQIESGKLTAEELANQQRRMESSHGFRDLDVFEAETADEEETENGVEENQWGEDALLAGVVATSLAELQAERDEVQTLRLTALQLYESGDESKFNRMLDSFRNPQFADEKFLVFSEHRDTLEYIVLRLKGLGYQDQVAFIHGGMDYREREQQVDFFRKDTRLGGARYMVCTDAAGEGLNMQFCRLMVNYDIPWNPARIEQRFGRIHRYGQKATLVLLFNLVANQTREGKVLKRLLDKLEVIRKALTSDKVFDVIGAQFEGISLRDLMLRAVVEENEDAIADQIDGLITADKARNTMRRLERICPSTGDVAKHLPEQRLQLEKEDLRRLLPGYVRRFLEKACPLLGLGFEGDLDETFRLVAAPRGAADWLLPLLEGYPQGSKNSFTVLKRGDLPSAIFLHPGERIFDGLCGLIQNRFGSEALRGAVFTDPWAETPYFVHVARVRLVRAGLDGHGHAGSPRVETLDCRLLAVKQTLNGDCVQMALEQLLLLRGLELSSAVVGNAPSQGGIAVERATQWLTTQLLEPQLEQRRMELRDSIPQRLEFLQRGFAYQEAELAIERARRSEKARAGDARARQLLERVKEQQRNLADQRDRACAEVTAEPDLLRAEPPEYVAHALVIPSTDPEERKRHDREIEKIAMQKSIGYEEEQGRSVVDVSVPEHAVMQGLEAWPGFDLISRADHRDVLAIEVKGCAEVGEVQVSENEWAKACNLRDRYWLYVVFNCAGPHPELHRVQDPFGKLIAHAQGGIVFDPVSILQSAERV